MLDEAATISCGVSFLTQPHFEGCEGTGDIQPSLSYDDRDSTEMREPEPQCIDPPPVPEFADHYKNKA